MSMPSCLLALFFTSANSYSHVVDAELGMLLHVDSTRGARDIQPSHLPDAWYGKSHRAARQRGVIQDKHMQGGHTRRAWLHRLSSGYAPHICANQASHSQLSWQTAQCIACCLFRIGPRNRGCHRLWRCFHRRLPVFLAGTRGKA